jgi:hypothetical protein
MMRLPAPEPFVLSLEGLASGRGADAEFPLLPSFLPDAGGVFI